MNISIGIQEWLLSGLAALLPAYLIFAAEQNDTVEGPSAASVSSRRERSKSILLKIFLPLISSLGQLISLIPLGERRIQLNKKLIQAGRPGGLSADEFHASRFICILFGTAAGCFIDGEIGTTPTIAVLLGLLGVVYPDIWLKGAIEKRTRSIFRNLPDTLDILRLAIDAGLDLGSAFKVVVERARKTALIDELERVERDMTLGQTRKEALKAFADRVSMTEINAFVLALVQADELGSGISPVLRAQSEMARTRRWQLAEACVNRLPMKMLGPLVLLIFPSSFVILFTPLLIQWMQTS